MPFLYVHVTICMHGSLISLNLEIFFDSMIISNNIIANHGFETASFLSNRVMKERIDENPPWVSDDALTSADK